MLYKQRLVSANFFFNDADNSSHQISHSKAAASVHACVATIYLSNFFMKVKATCSQ